MLLNLLFVATRIAATHQDIMSPLQAAGYMDSPARKSVEEIIFNCTCFYFKQNQSTYEKQGRIITA